MGVMMLNNSAILPSNTVFLGPFDNDWHWQLQTVLFLCGFFLLFGALSMKVLSDIILMPCECIIKSKSKKEQIEDYFQQL